MQRFWIVWCITGGPPTRRHESFEAARAEAERLARSCAPSEFIVLVSVGSCQKVDVQWNEHHCDYANEMPF